MSICDKFNKLPLNIAEEYLGVRDYEFDPESEDESDRDDGPLNRDTLYFCPELKDHVISPEPGDFPILIMWEWGNDFDRVGNIKTRYFDWMSMTEVPTICEENDSHIKKISDLWDKNHRADHEEWLRLAKEQNKHRRSNGG